MTTRKDDQQCAINTDRELWRERDGDYYADSIHVTEGGGIGINCGGTVFVKPVRQWHALAVKDAAPLAAPADRGAEQVMWPCAKHAHLSWSVLTPGNMATPLTVKTVCPHCPPDSPRGGK